MKQLHIYLILKLRRIAVDTERTRYNEKSYEY